MFSVQNRITQYRVSKLHRKIFDIITTNYVDMKIILY